MQRPQRQPETDMDSHTVLTLTLGAVSVVGTLGAMLRPVLLAWLLSDEDE